MSVDEVKINKNLFDITYFFNSVIDFEKKDCFNKQIKILSVDYGTNKIGIAISDNKCQIAFPKNVLIGNWCNKNNVVEEISKIIKINNINGIVFGFPKTLDNKLHENCVFILKIAEELQKRYKQKRYKFPILLFDERFSTKMANFEERFDRKNKTKYDDSKSATIILNNVISTFEKMKFNI